MILPRPHSVSGIQTHPIFQFFVISNNHTAVTHSSKILGGIEANTTEVAPRSGRPSVDVSYDRLGSILDDDKSMLIAYRHNLIHVCTLSKQVDRDHGLGLFGNCRSK